METYTQALLAELKTARLGDMQERTIKTIYIGGGTPTTLSAPFLCEIIEEARKFNVIDDVEITVEVNPSSVHPPSANYLSTDYFSALKTAGVNRLSIGLQAFQDPLLAKIGRTHTAQDFTDTFRAARDAGFDNINVDLMFSIPGQTLDDWRESLTKLLTLRPEHISTYSLTPAENTPLWLNLENKKITLPDDETDRAMYHEAIRILSSAGYNRYEISNFAKPNRKSRHNINTWKHHPYRGFGLGAHSFENNTRWHNTEDMEKYLHAFNNAMPSSVRENITPLTQKELQCEKIILGLRLAEGIKYTQIIDNDYGQKIKKLIADGLLTLQNNRICLTPLGTDLANRVFVEFM